MIDASDMQTIGEVIRRLRIERGISVEDLAFRAGTNGANISRLERNLQGYSEQRLQAIAQVLGVTLQDIWAIAALNDDELELVQLYRDIPTDQRIALIKLLSTMAGVRRHEKLLEGPKQRGGA